MNVCGPVAGCSSLWCVYLGSGGCGIAPRGPGLVSDWRSEPRPALHHCGQQRSVLKFSISWQNKILTECTSNTWSSSKNTCPHPPPTGVLRVWEASTSRCVYTQTLPSATPPAGKEGGEPHDGDDPRSLTYLLTMGASHRVAAVTAEHNITLYQLPALSTQQQVGRPDRKRG